MRIASRMAITQFIGGQAVVLSGSSVLADPALPPSVADLGPGMVDDHRVQVVAAAAGAVRP